MKYLKVWTDFISILSPLNDDEIGRLFVAMLNYAATGAEPRDFAGNEVFLWAVAKRDIDMMVEKSETLRQNGSKGGRPKTKENQIEPNETKENQTEPNKSLKEKKRKEIEIKENEIGISKPQKRFTPPTREEVQAYCKERGNNVDAERFVDFYTAKCWMIGKNPMRDWKAAVRTWERSDNQRKPVALLPAQNYQQRDYSGYEDEALERMLQQHEEKFGKKA
jgi:hypothetical protein